MSVSPGKLKILYILKDLMENSDEEHLLSSTELMSDLEKYGLSADRKSVYNDIDTLKDAGVEINQKKGTNPGYYIAGRDFELPELRLLVDAVQSSKFITSKKSDELIHKLEKLTSRYNADQLGRNVFISNRPKAGNETIYYNVDYIHTAILKNRKIQFQYTEWTVEKKLKPRKEGCLYVVSPWAMTWSDENYYLIAHDQESDQIRHYRVDKMRKTDVMECKRLGKERFADFDLAAFSKKTFGMYGGRDEEVTLSCSNNLAGVIINRFGNDTMMIPDGGEHFHVRVLIAVSQQFFGWLAGIGTDIQILKPDDVKQEYVDYLANILQTYQTEATQTDTGEDL